MAAEFIGYTILVTLQHPTGGQLQGVVSDVINQKLFLRDGRYLLGHFAQRLNKTVLLKWSGQRLPSYTLDASAILDLEIAPTASTENDLPTPTQSHPHDLPQSTQFIDPAIVSYGKPPRPNPPQVPPALSPVMIANGALVSPLLAPTSQGLRGQSSVSSIATAKKSGRRTSTATATLTEPFDALAIDSRDGGEKASKAEKHVSQTAPGIIDMKDVNHAPLKPQKKPSKGKGWRNTPLIEERPRQTKKQRGRQMADDPNGWATEDATDIADMGDFDFESNLSKFDKRKVFDDIRKDDPTAEDDRLVSFNRKAKPGTNGGRNLHFTENVLDIPDTHDSSRWKSEAGETEEDENRDGHYSSGKGSKRAGSRRPLQSRKGSTLPAHLDRKEPSPKPLMRMPTGSPLNGSISGFRASFRLGTNKPCHCVSPLQMLELEQLCTSELGLTEDILSENAGRSLAEAVLKNGDVRNVLFLVGNHKSGARAIAAARHLRNRRLRVTVCVLGGEREDSLFDIVRKHLNVYQKGMGYVERWDDYQAKLASGGPAPDFVVDALLGVHYAFDELRMDDQATVFSMIKWMNRNHTVLSVDVPSGVSATSGVVAEVDGQSLLVNSTQVVCLGAPKTGLLIAMSGDHINQSTQALVADIGISTAAWQKNGSRRKHGIDFGSEWVVPLKFVNG